MPEGGLIPGGATPMNTTGMGGVDASHLDPQKQETVELLPKKKNKKKKHMKTLKEYIMKENVNESSIPVNADHKKVIVDILLAEYKKGTKELMTALTNTDDKWFDNLAKDYVSFVTGAFGKPDEKILKQVKDGITAFKASVKLGVKESVNENKATYMDHKKVFMDMLRYAYKKDNKDLMASLNNNDDSFFNKLVDNYMHEYKNESKETRERIFKLVKDAINEFKTSVKFGVKDDKEKILDDLYDVLLNNTDNCTLEEFRKKYIKNDAKIDHDNLWIKLNKDYGLNVIRLID